MNKDISDISETGNGILGISSIRNEVNDIKIRKKRYVVFDLETTNPVKLRIVSTGGCDRHADVRDTPDLDELRKYFDSCIKCIDASSPYFIVYDFGYYNEQGSYRSMLILVSYVPEDVGARKKMAIASNLNFIQGFLNIPHLVQADDISDFTYENLIHFCSGIQRK